MRLWSGEKGEKQKGQIDWLITLFPLSCIIILSICFFFMPEQSNVVLGKIRYLLGDTLGVYYLLIGLAVFLLSVYLAASKYGGIVLGERGGVKSRSILFSHGAP